VALESLGGSLHPRVAPDWFGFGASVMADRSVAAAMLLEQVLTRPRFDPTEIALERATLAEEARQGADDMVRFPIQLALAEAFGDEGYGVPSHGSPESVAGLTEGMVRAWHACELASGRTTVVAVGDIDPDALAEGLAGVFGDSPAREWAPLRAPAAWLGSADRPASVVRRAKRQSAIALLFPGPARIDPARHSAEVWAAIASGLGGRLFSALRDRRSLAYTVIATSWQQTGTGALMAYLATSPEREDEAREALLTELARFRDDAPEKEELSRAVNYLAGQAQVRRQTASAVAGEIAEAWLVGDGLSEVAEPARGYRRVTGTEVQALADRCLAPQRRAEGIVRGGEITPL
jgi:zinc protease